MRYRKNKSFRFRTNGRGRHARQNGSDQTRMNLYSFSNSNDRPRNNFKSNQSADKLAEKYFTLAKEALSSGDIILSENYFQHADHFMRIVQIKNQNRIENSDDNKIVEKNLKENNQDTPDNQNKSIEEEKNKK